MSPNYERSDTFHCFLGNILISKCKRGNIIQNETIIGKNLFMNAKDARGAYDSYPICITIRHTCKSRLAIRLDLNVNTDGSAGEHTQTHTVMSVTLCDGSFVLCYVTAEISAQVMVRPQITKSI